MGAPKFTKFEMQIMETLWERGAAPIRDIQEAFPEDERPAYTTVQTIIYRLEEKKVVRRLHKVGNAHLFEAVVSRKAAHRKLVDEFLGLFGGRTQPVIARFIESGKFTMNDVREAEKIIQKLDAQKKKR
jgi:BlaI family transcriptional regulator, penicillinase repressor